jgi:uncharacterized protein YneF (UPF0154 family)
MSATEMVLTALAISLVIVVAMAVGFFLGIVLTTDKPKR